MSSDRTRLVPAPPDSPLREECQRWMQTQGEECDPFSPEQNVWAIVRGTLLHGVIVMQPALTLQAHFDSGGTAPATMHAWDAVEAALDFNGINPLVLVKDPGPLKDAALRRLDPYKAGYSAWRLRQTQVTGSTRPAAQSEPETTPTAPPKKKRAGKK